MRVYTSNENMSVTEDDPEIITIKNNLKLQKWLARPDVIMYP